jgi:murein DD-endopeptidase MepM/ murein hydrolase activator NlpD
MKIFWLLILGIITTAYAGQIYKYKNSNGNWIFTDKQPERINTFETLKYTKSKIPTTRITLYYVKNSNGFTLHAKNDFYSSVEIGFTVPDSQKFLKKVIPARDSIELFYTDTNNRKVDYHWALGDPSSIADNYPYHIPFTSPREHKITQAFNGKFSHKNDYNKYAVDIAMNIGTYITAVRAGTVVWAKDNYHMSGTTSYFLDKANGIKVLHKDGTFALYAHILMDTAVVKPGDKVKAGDQLARSGSSGFSTGPHLHFSINKNIGLKNISIPFKFINNNGTVFTPKKSMNIGGSGKY